MTKAEKVAFLILVKLVAHIAHYLVSKDEARLSFISDTQTALYEAVGYIED